MGRCPAAQSRGRARASRRSRTRPATRATRISGSQGARATAKRTRFSPRVCKSSTDADQARATGLRQTSLRYFNVVGSGTGEVFDPSPHNLFPLVFDALLEGRTPRINGDDYPTPDGTCVRDYIHVSDLAEAHVAAYGLLREGGESHTFNCGNGRGYSVREVIRAVEAAVGHPLRLAYEGRRPGDPPELVADPGRLLQRVAWRPRYGLADMVETALAWERRQAAGWSEAGSRAAFPQTQPLKPISKPNP